jgi:acid stress-induced BolA-like protein IbaG/YrbA
MAAIKLTKDKLAEILVRRLGLQQPIFHLEKSGGRLVGDIISPSFKGRGDEERQTLIWDALASEFGAESVRLVGILLAYTPDEWNLNDDGIPQARKGKKAG